MITIYTEYMARNDWIQYTVTDELKKVMEA